MIGAILPLTVSFLVIILSSRTRVEGGPAPFRGRPYWLVVLVIALLATMIFSISHVIYGGIVLTSSWATGMAFAIMSSGAAYWWFRGRTAAVQVGAAEIYVMWTFGCFGSDVLRTLTGLARVPAGEALWGGGGLQDLLFWSGLYAVLSFLSLVIFLRLLRPLSERAKHGGLRN